MNSKDHLYEKLVHIDDLKDGWYGPHSVRLSDVVLDNAYRVVDDLAYHAAGNIILAPTPAGGVLFEVLDGNHFEVRDAEIESTGETIYMTWYSVTSDDLEEYSGVFDQDVMVKFLETGEFPG